METTPHSPDKASNVLAATVIARGHSRHGCMVLEIVTDGNDGKPRTTRRIVRMDGRPLGWCAAMESSTPSHAPSKAVAPSPTPAPTPAPEPSPVPTPAPPSSLLQLDLQGQLDRKSAERRAESARKARLGQEVQTYLVDEKVYLPHTYLKKLREQAGLTQRDLSLAMGYRGHGTIAMAETGVRERTAVRAIEFLQDRFGIGVPALETTPSSEADLSCATVVV
jgi:hypothetical protein